MSFSTLAALLILTSGIVATVIFARILRHRAARKAFKPTTVPQPATRRTIDPLPSVQPTAAPGAPTDRPSALPRDGIARFPIPGAGGADSLADADATIPSHADVEPVTVTERRPRVDMTFPKPEKSLGATLPISVHAQSPNEIADGRPCSQRIGRHRDRSSPVRTPQRSAHHRGGGRWRPAAHRS